MIKMVNFVLCIFYDNEKKVKKDAMKNSHPPLTLNGRNLRSFFQSTGCTVMKVFSSCTFSAGFCILPSEPENWSKSSLCSEVKMLNLHLCKFAASTDAESVLNSTSPSSSKYLFQVGKQVPGCSKPFPSLLQCSR